MAGDIRGLGRGGANHELSIATQGSFCRLSRVLQLMPLSLHRRILMKRIIAVPLAWNLSCSALLFGGRELRAFKKTLVRSNTRSVYKGDDDDRWIAEHPEIHRIADIEAKRILLGKTSGFERMYARVTKLYFSGMARHLADLRRVLKPGARLALVSWEIKPHFSE